MFVDASAIVAMLAGEDDAADLSGRFSRAESVTTSAVAVYEAVLGLARAQSISTSDAETAIDDLLSHARAEIIPITAEIGRAAIRAFERFGRGRHPARLNMGDCFAYACARALGVPLLFKGDNFALTDIAAG
jgi:ribonuclease VapC